MFSVYEHLKECRANIVGFVNFFEREIETEIVEKWRQLVKKLRNFLGEKQKSEEFI